MGRTHKGWSRSQQILFHRACAAAEWSPAQRYIAMRHAGCPNARGKDRPSITDPRLTNAQFEQAMALAELGAVSAGNGGAVPKPRNHATWHAASLSGRTRQVQLIESIAAEAADRIPDRYDAAGLIAYAVRHTTRDDDEAVTGMPRPTDLKGCDGGQLLRVTELLRAMVGRELLARGLTPRTFTAPPEAHRRASPRPTPARKEASCTSTSAPAVATTPAAPSTAPARSAA